VPGAADSWYPEKESAWLYRAVAAAESEPARRALFEKLAAAAEDQAGLLRHIHPRHLRPMLGLRGGLRLLLIGGGAGLAAWGVGKLLGAEFS